MSAHVHPADVAQLRGDLQRAIGALCQRCGLDPQTVRELVEDLRAWSAAPLDWMTAPALLEYGLELEADVAALQGPHPRRTGPVSGADAPAANDVPPTHGIVTPGDVLSYRALWDDYVTGTARAAASCSALWDQAAAAAANPAQPAPAGVNLGQFAAAPDQATIQLWADTEQANSDAILLRWNLHANTPDEQLLLNAPSILADFQDAVLKVGQFYQPQIARDCPAIALPSGPTLDAQTAVIAQLEGLGVVAHGLLQLLGEGAGGSLDTLGAIGHAAAQVVDTIASPVPWIAAGVVGLGILALALRR